MYSWSKKRDKKKSNRRGQFTLFIIVGLVIFFVLGFALYARAKIINAQISTQAEKQIKEYIDRNAISQYITSCLDAVSEDVIIKAALQGGTFNFSGQTENKDYIVFNDSTYNRTVNVSIIVKPNLACPDGSSQSTHIFYPEPTYLGTPDYPYRCGYVPINELYNLYTQYGTGPCKNHCVKNDFLVYSGFFGINNLKRLCSNNGANRFLIDDSSVSRTNYISCDYYSNKNKSMQQYIEEQINNDLTICLNFTEILKRSPSNITVNDTPISEVQFKNNRFSVKVVYPFTLTMRNHPPITKLMDFSVEKDIAFKELYEYTYELVNYDVKKAEFDIINDRMNVLSRGNRRANTNIYTSNYEVELIRGNSSNDFIDIIRVIDKEHKVRDLPLIINLGFVNRRPVLDYIHQSSSSTQFDILVVENDTVSLNPLGYDPDNDLIIYDYGFWREDYIDMYNISDEKCTNPTSIEYVVENCTKINSSANAPHNWTNSSAYRTTSKNATYKVTAEDAGFHKVKVSVIDTMHNLEDYQNVKILVFDLPIVKISGDNSYSDVDKNRASYEDIYTLDGSASTVSAIGEAMGYTQFSTFFWLDPVEQFDTRILITTTEDKVLTIPNATIGLAQGVTILNIKDYIFRNKTSTPVIHDISLTATVQTLGISDTEFYAVNVTECLNHSNLLDPPYPYNNNPTNIYESLQADHRCCSDEYTYEGTNTQCYNMTKYGLNRKFNNYTITPTQSPVTNMRGGIKYQKLDGNPISNPGTIDSIDPSESNYIYSNDIFEQYFTRYCSGDRGNICTGYATEVRKVVAACNDTNYGTPHVERCSGPSSFGPSDTQMSCTNYNSEMTFEKKINSASYTGKCTGNTRMQSNSVTWGGGIYACFGRCDINTGKCIPITSGIYECVCSIEFGESSVSPACNGKKPYYTQIYTCTKKPNFKDTCNNCNLITTNTCLSNDNSGCNANDLCHLKSPGEPTGQCSVGNQGIIDQCSSTCLLEDVPSTDMSYKCKQNSGCISDNNCIDKKPNSAATGGAGICNTNCQEDPCPNDFKVNTGVYPIECREECDLSENIILAHVGSNPSCASGKVCCFGGQSCGELGCQEAAI